MRISQQSVTRKVFLCSKHVASSVGCRTPGLSFHAVALAFACAFDPVFALCFAFTREVVNVHQFLTLSALHF